MTTRELPLSEHYRLADTLLDKVWQTLPDDATVLVMEDDSVIVGCVLLFRAFHLEGAWIHPAYRHRIGVGRRLLRAVKRLLVDRDINEVLTTAHNARGKKLSQSLGSLIALTCEHFAVQVGR